MDFQNTIRQIVEKEWEMFISVNGTCRVACQNNPEMFTALRTAQFTAWSPEAAASYLHDLMEAEQEGRNLVREKYIWMMKNTEPANFGKLKSGLPACSAEKDALVKQIVDELLAQTEQLRTQYPLLALSGRPLLAAEETEGFTSVETYQQGELKTYSTDTLQALWHHMETLKAQGISLAYRIQENSVTCLGYTSMEDAERVMREQILAQSGEGSCCQ